MLIGRQLPRCAATSPEKLHLALSVSNHLHHRPPCPSHFSSQVAKFKMTKRGLCSQFYGGVPLCPGRLLPRHSWTQPTRKVLNSGSGEPLGGKVLNWILKVSKKVFDAKKGAVHIFPNQHSIHWCLLPSCLTLSLKKRLFTI